MIKEVFIPDIYIKNYKELDLNHLKSRGIKVLLLDIDNTLVEAHSSIISDEAVNFIEQIKNTHILPVIVSNNIQSRVEFLATRLNCDYIYFSLKPLKISFKKILKKYSVNKEEVAIFGDQILTDILGGNRMNILTILSDPISKKDNFYGTIIRVMEQLVHKAINFKKGEYYDGM